MNKCIKGNKEEEAGEGGQERGEGDCTGQRGGEKPGGQVGGGWLAKAGSGKEDLGSTERRVGPAGMQLPKRIVMKTGGTGHAGSKNSWS